MTRRSGFDGESAGQESTDSTGYPDSRRLKARISAAADQCVRCGLCLPHCPTYEELRDEAESPRGRIALMQGWAEGQIPGSQSLQDHLGNCLECGACESACPSLVRFIDIMDDARALSNQESGNSAGLFRRLSLRILSSRSGVRAAALLGSAYRVSRLQKLVERSRRLKAMPLATVIHGLAIQLRRPARIVTRQPASNGSAGVRSLFLGCIARAAQPGTLEAAAMVLEHLGYSVDIPENQACCGAMYRHNGFPEQADRLLSQNGEAFVEGTPVGVASACLAELRRQPLLRGALEISRLLADLEWPEDCELRPLSHRVAVHVPCSQRNILRDGNAAFDLLRRIPGIELVELPDNRLCCGAAGTYLIQRPRLSRTLVQSKILYLADLDTRILVTTNTGCALQLAAGIQESGLEIEVLHPVELIARQLQVTAETA